MSVQPPKIDKRTYQEIVAQTESLAQQFTEWRPNPDGKPDAGRALIRIFGRMAALVSDRLNQLPDKNFLTFLDAIGTQLLPPQPARVPLTFNVVPGSPPDAFVPAGTQVAAPPAEGEEQEVVFETERNLTLTAAQLQAAFVRQPETDKYGDRTAQATGKLDAAFAAFEGEVAVEHYLYLACDALFSVTETKTVNLTIYSPQAADFAKLPLSWAYWNGTTWQPVLALLAPASDRLLVSIRDLPAPARTTVNNQQAAWLRVGLNASVPSTLPLPSIRAIAARAEIQRNTSIPPDLCFFNGALLDLSKDFYPFGQQPRFNDTFHLASKEIFAKPGARVTVEVRLSDLAVNKNGAAEILWEAYNGSTWERLGQSSVSSPRTSGAADFNDGTLAFTQNGQIAFTLPSRVLPTLANGETTYWVRARLIKGNYGTEARYNSTTNSLGQTTTTFVPASFAPPSVQSVSLRYIYQSPDTPLSACQTYNDFTYVDRLAEATAGTDFQPFTRSADDRPTLYLGFDRPFPNRAIALYLQVEPPKAGEIASSTSLTAPARLVWEYAAPAGWLALGVLDETEAFSERGQIRFLGPQDFSTRSEFGQSLYWLRIRWESGEFLVPPRLKRVLLNTVWASQAVTIAEEILGSSNGNPNQTYRTTRSPVLLGQRLQVLEPSEPAPEERAAIEKLEGAKAIAIVRDNAEQVQGAWVTWHEVRDFYSSGPRDRHYVLDRVKGEIRFGSGLHGTIPPQGRSNIRLAPYRTGGGDRGNRAAATITELRTTVPYVASVSNLEAAAGGNDRESLDRVKERGPKVLRHRHRAVTVEDIEDLAVEASVEVARTLAIGPEFNPIDGLDWLPIYRLDLNAPGEIKVELKNFPEGLLLEVKISGPGQSNPYVSKQLNQTNPVATHTVTAEQFAAGSEWTVTFTNSGEPSSNVRAKITYPTNSINTEFGAPSSTFDISSNPYRSVKDAGKVVLVIVPNSSSPQPTPSLNLMEQVERYIRDRCSPTVELQVMEPDWVEVTVTAGIVPLSLEKGDDVRQAATDALVKFLHPLAGGATGRGWDFGRRPHLSDLYAILEKVDGVDCVDSLAIASPSLDLLPPDRRDRFLIYSGRHQINLVFPSKGV